MDDITLKEIKFKVVYSRRRSIGISIKPDSSVTVHAPYRTPSITIERLVRSKSSWIIRHIENFRNHVRINGSATIKEGSSILLHGKEYRVSIHKSLRTGVEITDDNIIILQNDLSDGDKTIKILGNWYKKTAENEIPVRFSILLSELANYNFKPNGLKVRSLKRRWGSCSTKGIITLNSDLIKLNEIYLDYVIIHELCHLRHLNHGKEYYRLLTEIFPEWKKVRKELRGYIL
jgi:predicted metal-dependent hydrolase